MNENKESHDCWKGIHAVRASCEKVKLDHTTELEIGRKGENFN